MKIDLFGRHKIYIEQSAEQINKGNLAEIISKILAVHNKNKCEITYLHEYLKGKQPILERQKQVNADITNKIVENHAAEIQTFKVGFTFGEPVQYVLYGDCDIHDKERRNDPRVKAYNELMRNDNKISKDKKLGDWLFQCGIGYRMCLPTPTGAAYPFYTVVPDPRQAWVALQDNFVEAPVLCGYTNRQGSKMDVWSIYKHWTITYATDSEGNITNDKPKIDEQPNVIGLLPIIQYAANETMQGCFEVVIDICDALNNLESNGVDSVEQVVQSLLWFNNIDIDEAKLNDVQRLKAIVTKSMNGYPATIQSVSQNLDQSQTSTLKDDLYKSMLTIAAVPDRRASTGGNTGQAIILSEGWVMAESAARDFENIFKCSENDFIKLSLKICANTHSSTPTDLGNLSAHEIDIHFTRRQNDNLLVKTQGLMNMLTSGVHPRHAFKICGLFSDPEQAYLDSKDYLAKYLIGEGTGEELIAAADNTDNTALSDEILAAFTKFNENVESINNEQEEA